MYDFIVTQCNTNTLAVVVEGARSGKSGFYIWATMETLTTLPYILLFQVSVPESVQDRAVLIYTGCKVGLMFTFRH